MTRPNVFVVGAPKCGTTSLYEYLGQHPDVFVSAKKELHYYSRVQLRARAAGPGDELVLDRIVETEDEYLSYFAKAAHQRRIVEVSPSYLFNHEVAKQIHDDSPDSYIIAILRDPVARAYSQWQHQRRSLQEPLSFHDALAAESSRTEAGWSDAWQYVESSKYAPGVKAYVDVFGVDRVHVMTAEELLLDPVGVMRDVFRFLDIDPLVQVKHARRNVGGEARSRVLARLLLRPNAVARVGGALFTQSFRSKLALKLTELNTAPSAPMPDAARRDLRSKFAEDVRDLEELLGRRMPWPH